MTFAWYGLLKEKGLALWKAMLLSWGIAFFEYLFRVPANRLGYLSSMSGFQLKITQEVTKLVVFSVFAVLYLKEPLQWKYLVSFVFSIGAVYFMIKK